MEIINNHIIKFTLRFKGLVPLVDDKNANYRLTGNSEILPSRSSWFFLGFVGLGDIVVRIGQVFVSRSKVYVPFIPTFEYSTSSLLYP